MTEDRIRELLREMRDEPAPPDSVARVVIETSRRIRRRRTLWVVAGAFAAAACLALAILPMRPLPPAAPQPVAGLRPVEPKPTPPTSVSPEARPARPARIRRAPAKRDDVVIRIETPDPDVVILLIGEE